MKANEKQPAMKSNMKRNENLMKSGPPAMKSNIKILWPNEKRI